MSKQDYDAELEAYTQGMKLEQDEQHDFDAWLDSMTAGMKLEVKAGRRCGRSRSAYVTHEGRKMSAGEYNIAVRQRIRKAEKQRRKQFKRWLRQIGEQDIQVTLQQDFQADWRQRIQQEYEAAHYVEKLASQIGIQMMAARMTGDFSKVVEQAKSRMFRQPTQRELRAAFRAYKASMLKRIAR